VPRLERRQPGELSAGEPQQTMTMKSRHGRSD
jgi:hypothetical protein